MFEDDFGIEDIIPEDLGCMGEQEIDPGVKEDAAASGETKTPTPKSFEHIPFEVKKRAHKLYETFEGEAKDMPFEDFCIELYALESPALMQEDLQRVVSEKQDRSRQAFANARNIERNLN